MPTTRRTTFQAGRRIAVVAVALALPLAACSSGGSDDSSGTSSGSSTADATPTKTITIKGFKFSPNPATVKAGEKVTVRNEDGSTHTFTSSDGPADFDTGDIASGDKKAVTLTDPGTYKYQCEIHDQMKGEIVVT